MEVSNKTYFVPDWNITDTLQNSRAAWTMAFDKSYCLFAKKISEFIAKDIFTVLKESCVNPFNLQPEVKRTITRTYPLNILKIEDAIKLKEMAQEAAELAPFNDWFARFAAPKKKEERIVENKANIIEDSCDAMSGPNFTKKTRYLTREQESNTAIDGSYFKDRMSVIGKRVCKDLVNTFNEFSKIPENKRLKVQVNWLNDGVDMGSFSKSLDVQVELWLEDEKSPSQPTQQLASLKEIEKQKKVENFNQLKGQAFYIGMTTLFVVVLGIGFVLNNKA
ncbi:MAG: hypothetical protein H0U49_01035 [Parachlamydiaceae bacterium]|nr:hypothetical protein [Parachlamydiaceae bacterium]